MKTAKSIKLPEERCREVPDGVTVLKASPSIRSPHLSFETQGNFHFKSLRCGLAFPSTLLFLLQAFKTLETAVIIRQKNLKFFCYRNMKFENGVTRNFKEHSLSKVHVMSAFSYLIPRHHLPKSRQNRSIRRQWKLTNFKTYE